MTYIDHGTDPESFAAWLREHPGGLSEGIDPTLGSGYRAPKDAQPERYAYRVHSEKRGNDRVTITEWNW